MVRGAPRWLGLLAALAVLVTTSAALGAVPSLETASQRQASLRSQAAGDKIDLSVTVTAGKLASHTRSGLALGGDTRLAFGGDALLPWKVLSVLLTSKDPISDLQEHVGPIDASKTSIETLDDDFVYVWGQVPGLALSRNLGRIRRITTTSGNETWEFRLSGELDLAGLPERIYILRSGEPYATVELAKGQANKD